MELSLRDHQMDVIDRLREGFRDGKRTQLLYAPTGFGKTEVAIYLMQATEANKKRASIVLDRIVLVDQTSMRLSKYGLGHGVYQSGHWKYNPSSALQVCSAQTLEARQDFPAGDLVIIDECHVGRKQTSEFIRNNPDIKVIGLTATPFTKGLGGLYDHVVCGSTNRWLVENKWLTPLRVFIAKEIDMTGAKKVAGEWSQDIVTKRGMQITGDIVSEWVKKTHEIFGRPRKTIVFCAGVAHGADLVQQFAEQGYNFVSISYKDDDEFKKQAIEDFAKPDTEIQGLIATDILTRGFDVSDVMIGVSARPFSKSFSSHVQQMGRVMRPHEGKDFALWLCMAKGSKVLTDKGLIHIDKVKLHHKIWDGANFVNHKGAVCNGIQEVITYQGLTATEGHLVHTTEGWRTFGECASKQIRITQTGFGGTAIRLGENIRPASFLVGSKTKKIYACFLRVCNLWIQKSNITIKFTKRENKRMQGLQSARASISNVALQQSSSNESKMLVQFMRPISSIWRKRNKIQLLWSKARDYVDYGKSWDSRVFISGGALTYATGQDKSKWALRSWEFAVAFSRVKPAKQMWKSIGSEDAQIQNGLPSNSLFRQYIEAFLLGWNDSRANNREIPQAISKAKREVWDILNCGQNNRFTCEGLLVHNCHSGNYLRFRDDWDDLYDNGVKDLDADGEKAKKEPTEQEKKELKCPSCGALWNVKSDACPSCGFVRQRQSQVGSVPGLMEELAPSGGNRIDRQQFYSELLCYANSRSYNPNWAKHKYKEKFGAFPRGLHEVHTTVSAPTAKWIRHRNIAWAKSRRNV